MPDPYLAAHTDSTRNDARALRHIAQWGRTATAFQALNPGIAHWFDDADRGMVGYMDTGGAWVAAGETIAAEEHVVAVAERFVQAAHAAGRRVCFFATEGGLAASTEMRRLLIGQQPLWDPREWDGHVRRHRSFREQLRRARAKQVMVREVDADTLMDSPALRSQIDAVGRAWLAARPMPPMSFLVAVAPLAYAEHRRLFVAERVGEVIGVLSLAPVPAQDGWLFEHLLRHPRAPNGSVDLLVDAAMRVLAAEQVPWATLGLAPLAGDVSSWLRRARSWSQPLFNFEGLAAFKRKLRPQRWAPVYLVYPKHASGFVALIDALRAFAGGALWRFGARTALRGPRPLLMALEWSLIPWTLLLAACPTKPWFPAPSIHLAWVLFDVVLYLTLRIARARQSLALLTAAASGVSLDVVLTLWQAASWNLPHAQTRGAVWVIAVACLGPLLAAPLLWGAVRRALRVRAL
ncbi:MAG: DUF2156 domain-containing protein [Gemmatimonadaceae bacterium]|nr:DUF2156 domain-containing protein [Gemmatimonadaceae bacterium]